MDKYPQCSIIGFGRFGHLLAKILAEEYVVTVTDKDDRAENHIVAGEIGVEFVGLEQACQAETIFLCVPISSLDSIIQQARMYLRPGSLVMDTCSVKVHPAHVLHKTPSTINILGTHPLFGPDSARYGVSGLRMIFCPLRVSNQELNRWRTFWERRGVRVIEMTPDEHDQLAAYSQGITHFIGRVLGELQLRPNEVMTKGFEAILGVIEQTNHDTWQLFEDLQKYNPYTAQMRHDLEHAFKTIQTRLNSEEIDL